MRQGSGGGSPGGGGGLGALTGSIEPASPDSEDDIG